MPYIEFLPCSQPLSTIHKLYKVSLKPLSLSLFLSCKLLCPTDAQLFSAANMYISPRNENLSNFYGRQIYSWNWWLFFFVFRYGTASVPDPQASMLGITKVLCLSFNGMSVIQSWRTRSRYFVCQTFKSKSTKIPFIQVWPLRCRWRRRFASTKTRFLPTTELF